MSHDYEEMLKSHAIQTARQLLGSTGAQTVRTMERLGVFELIKKPEPDSTPPIEPGLVGVWKAGEHEGKPGFARDPEREAEWSMWADVPFIPARSGKRRIALIGESVARGYFYDPYFTPAMVLERMLNRGSPARAETEVIDLARNDLKPLELASLAQAAMALQPDALVIFAGNNWLHGLAPKGLESRILASLLQREGVAGVQAFYRHKLAEEVGGQAAEGLRRLAAYAPVFLIIPEFNLMDWRREEGADAPLLDEGQTARWWECRAHAESELNAGRLDAAEGYARQMTAMDQGAAASGLLLLAECKIRAGEPGQARAFLEAARDAHLWDTGVKTPRTVSIIQDIFRQARVAPGVTVVDLPAFFANQREGSLPDRRLFLDYCHHTAEGIRLAMAAVAEKLLPHLGAAECDAAALAREQPEPAAEVEASARFAAAIHCAHWGQSYDIVHHHCVKALAASESMAKAMNAYARMQTGAAPSWMSLGATELADVAPPSLTRYLTKYNLKSFDHTLMEAIGNALSEKSGASHSGFDQHRLDAYGVAPQRPVNLLDAVYRPNWTDRQWPSEDHAYFRALAPVSNFFFMARNDWDLDITIDFRGVISGEEDSFCVKVNDWEVGSDSLSMHWSRANFTVPAAILLYGVNKLALHWPVKADEPSGLKLAADRLARALPYNLYPVFGEAHALVLRSVPI